MPRSCSAVLQYANKHAFLAFVTHNPQGSIGAQMYNIRYSVFCDLCV